MNCALEIVKAVRAVKFRYRPTPETRELLETFKMMVNNAINICLAEKIKGRFKLRNRIYQEFQERYGVVSCYPYSVAEVAWSIVKKHKRWERKPHAEHLMLKMDSANYSLNYGILNIPNRKGHRLLIPLEYGDYQRSFLMDETLNRGSVTMTDLTISISFSKDIAEIEPLRKVGIDLNEKSIAASDGIKYDLSEVARLHTEYGIRRSNFQAKHSRDRRLKQKFSLQSREKNRVKQLLNRVSKGIVQRAKENREVIVLEKLKGIRYTHKKGNGEGRDKRRRIAQWPFRMLQSMIQHKAAWEGIPVEYVSPANTSKLCFNCGYLNKSLKLTDRAWQCPQCGCQLDRDLNAAINIEKRGTIACQSLVLAEARGG